MKVLVACEFSGIVREAFRKRGHDAYSCDIIDSDDNSIYHKKMDILYLLKQPLKWDLMIAHPPCTYLSNAGARFLYPKGILNRDRLCQGLEAAKFFIRLLECDIPKICIENPIPSTAYELPPYTQIIQPYYFGDPYQKKTCLWLKNLPILQYSQWRYEKPESTKIAGNWFNKGGKDRQKNRARTFQGIANAMAEQWG